MNMDVTVFITVLRMHVINKCFFFICWAKKKKSDFTIHINRLSNM